MTDNELLAAILAEMETQNGELETIVFLLQSGVCGLAFLGAGVLVAGWLFSRRDAEF